jgi:hypothetical protein
MSRAAVNEGTYGSDEIARRVEKHNLNDDQRGEGNYMQSGRGESQGTSLKPPHEHIGEQKQDQEKG